jgi:tRNA uridine 5-carbamoylmethylation protein Kti12
MLNFEKIRVGTTTLENDLSDWLEENIADWDELSAGSRRRFMNDVKVQLEVSAEKGQEVQVAHVIHSYLQWYTCVIDLRSFL